MLNVVIVDDEFKSREVLKEMLKMYCPDVHVSATAHDVKSSLEAIREFSPDLIFLDIELEQETGFDLLEQAAPIDFKVVFTTAYTHYAINAIKASAIDYLVKPVNPEELKSAVSKALEQKKAHSLKDQMDKLFATLKEPSKQKIGLPTKDGLIFILIEEIIACEADGTYTCIHLNNSSKILVSKSLKDYEVSLAPYNFLRVHNSYLINMNEVKRYFRGDGGYVIMSNDLKIDVSKRRKEIFLSKINLA
jgi:two-component system, LytTR family, response regulator